MKNSVISIVVGLVIIVAVIFFVMRGNGDETVVPTATATPAATVAPVGLIQLAPTTTPQVTPSPNAPVAAAPAGVTVSIDDTSFTPATVTVKAGTTVTFVNNGQGTHWPASNPHPIHTGLAGLDAKKALSTGETFSFTFSKVGTFGFHDHLNTRVTGTVVVQ